jgi:hypothetical protein
MRSGRSAAAANALHLAIDRLVFFGDHGVTVRPRPDRNDFRRGSLPSCPPDARSRWQLRKLIAFDDDTLDKLTQLARDRMATFQELADEAFADVLKKHGIPIDLKDALRKSAALSKTATPKKTRSKPPRTTS